MLAAGVAALGCAATPAVSAGALLYPDNPPVTVEYRGATYFAGGSGPLLGLYRTDGTPTSTKRVAQADVPNNVSIDGLAVFGDRLVFTTGESYAAPGTLFVSDGTAAGTRRALKVQQTGPLTDAQANRALSLGRPIVAGRKLYVQGSRNGGHDRLYRVDLEQGRLSVVQGSGPGLREFLGYSYPIAASADGGLFFVYSRDSDELWHVGPTGPAVRLAVSVQATEQGVLGDALYFAARDRERGLEPWVTDGTPGGTRLLGDLTPGAASSDIGGFTPSAGSMYALVGKADGASNVPHVPYLLTGAAGPAPVTWHGQPIVTRGWALVPSTSGLWFGSGWGPGAVRYRVPPGGTIAERPLGAGFDEHGTLIVPSTRFYASANSVRSSDADGATSVLSTTGLAPSSRQGYEPAITWWSPGPDRVWFLAPVVDDGPSVLWTSDGTAAGTHPAVTPGQIDPVASVIKAEATRRRLTQAPYRWSVTGTVTPLGIDPTTAASLCRGTVDFTTTRRASWRVLFRARARVRWTGSACAFSGVVRPPRHVLAAGRGTLAIAAQFRGTRHVSAPRLDERIGVRYD